MTYLYRIPQGLPWLPSARGSVTSCTKLRTKFRGALPDNVTFDFSCPDDVSSGQEAIRPMLILYGTQEYRNERCLDFVVEASTAFLRCLIFCEKTKCFCCRALITRSLTKSYTDFVAPTKNVSHKLHSRFRLMGPRYRRLLPVLTQMKQQLSRVQQKAMSRIVPKCGYNGNTK